MEEIEEKLNIIEESVEELEGLKVEENRFLEYQGIKHTLQEAVEACIDIAGHIIASEGFGRQEDYADYFKELGERDIIDKDLSSSLEDMAKFRNLVVHRYAEIDPQLLQDILDNDLGDLIDFIKAVERYYENQN
jgi:uncharacterized protein YutE (UPF0331/DUF86 family)